MVFFIFFFFLFAVGMAEFDNYQEFAVTITDPSQDEVQVTVDSQTDGKMLTDCTDMLFVDEELKSLSDTLFSENAIWGGADSGASAKFAFLSQTACPATTSSLLTGQPNLEGNFIRISDVVDTNLLTKSSHTHPGAVPNLAPTTDTLVDLQSGSCQFGEISESGSTMGESTATTQSITLPDFGRMQVKSMSAYLVGCNDRRACDVGEDVKRFGVYTGGTETNMRDATLVQDFGTVADTGPGGKWYTCSGNVNGGDGIVHAGDLMWPVIKGDSTFRFYYSSSKPSETDFNTGRFEIESLGSTETNPFAPAVTVSETADQSNWLRNIYVTVDVYNGCDEHHDHSVSFTGLDAFVQLPAAEVDICVVDDQKHFDTEVPVGLIGMFLNNDVVMGWVDVGDLNAGERFPVLGSNFQVIPPGHTHDIEFEPQSTSCTLRQDQPVIATRMQWPVAVANVHTHDSMDGLTGCVSALSDTDYEYLPERVYLNFRSSQGAELQVGQMLLITCPDCEDGEEINPPLGWKVVDEFTGEKVHLVGADLPNRIGDKESEAFRDRHAHDNHQMCSTETSSVSTTITLEMAPTFGVKYPSTDHTHVIEGELADVDLEGDQVDSVAFVLIQKKDVLELGAVQDIGDWDKLIPKVCQDIETDDKDLVWKAEYNQFFCSYDGILFGVPRPDPKISNGLIIGIAAGGGGLVLIVFVLICILVSLCVMITCCVKKKKNAAQHEKIEEEELDDVRVGNPTPKKTLSGKSQGRGSKDGRKKKLGSLRVFLAEKVLKIDNVQTIIKEDQIGSENFAELKVNTDLYEVDMKEVELLKELGSGGSDSHVYLARWEGQEVATKMFHGKSFSDQDTYTLFEKEIEIMSSISHPNIIRFYGATLKPPRLAILLEYCANGTVKEFLANPNNQSIPFEKRADFIYGTACALVFIHARNIIHRDLKPDNVLLDDGLQAKLADFGLSRIFHSGSGNKTVRVGTCHYMAPEMITSNQYTEKVDIFSLGITIFEIITGNFSPYGLNADNIELKVARSADYRPVLPKGPDFPDWIVRLMENCWHHKETQRPTAKYVADMIKEKLC